MVSTPNSETRSRTGAERSHADDGIQRIGIDVQYRRQLHVDAHAAQLTGGGLSHPTRQVEVTGCADRHVARKDRRAAGDAHDEAALLVDGDKQRHRIGHRLQVGVQPRELWAALDVAPKERHPAQMPVLDEGAIRGVQRRPFEAEHEDLADLLFEGHARQHAPGAGPNDLLRSHQAVLDYDALIEAKASTTARGFVDFPVRRAPSSLGTAASCRSATCSTRAFGCSASIGSILRW